MRFHHTVMPRSLKNSAAHGVKFLVSVWLIFTVLFIFLYILPGDPVTAMIGTSSTPESSREIRHTLGLDRPFLDRYLLFLNNLVQLDWGVSLYTGQPVLSSAFKRFAVTFSYALPAGLVSLFVGYLLALTAHLKRSWVLKNFITGFSLIGSALPVYFITMITFWAARYLVPLPEVMLRFLLILVLSVYPVAFLLHLFMNFLENEVSKPYILQMKSFQIKTFDLYWKIIFKGAFETALGSVAPLLNIIIGNCFFIEYIFSIPGGCLWTVHAVVNQDFPVIYGATFFLALFYLGLNLTTKLIRTSFYGD